MRRRGGRAKSTYLLRLVPQSSCLVRARRVGEAIHARQLSVLPAAHSLQEPEDIRLLPLPELFDVFVSPHHGDDDHNV